MSNLTELEEFKKRIKKEINETKKDLSFLLGKYDGILAAISCVGNTDTEEKEEIEEEKTKSSLLVKKKTKIDRRNVKKKSYWESNDEKFVKSKVRENLSKIEKPFCTSTEIAVLVFNKPINNSSKEYAATNRALRTLRNENPNWLKFERSGTGYVYWLNENGQSGNNQKQQEQKKKQIFNLNLEQKIENILEKNKSKSFGNIDLARIIFEKEVKVEDLEYREVAETMRSLIKKNPRWLKFVKRSNKWEYQYRSSGSNLRSVKAFKSAKNIPQFPNLLK